MYKITELKGRAFKKAISSEIQSEWDGKRTYDGKKITEQDVIDLSLMNNSRYDSDGNWLGYGEE